MNRRDFLKFASAATLPASGLLPSTSEAFLGGFSFQGSSAIKQPTVAKRRRSLVLIKLAGGNDGLNTLVPARDYDLYSKARPEIAVPRHKLRDFDLGNGMAVNPYMQSLKPWWQKGKLAWVQGVGYPHGVLSHFRSGDIWDTATHANEYSDLGWLARIMPQYKDGLHGIVLGEAESQGPMAGRDCHTVCLESPKVFLSQVELVSNSQPARSGSSPVLAHVVNIQRQLYQAGRDLGTKLAQTKPLPQFSTSGIGRRMESVAQMIINGVDTAVYKVEHNGYDTHARQANVHSNLLLELSEALDSFATAMENNGCWDDVLVVTYSEFGRRVHENRGGGTDHGTASVQLVMGGRVQGGRVFGENPRIRDKDLDVDGNLQMTTDFRKVYSTLASRWFGVNNPWAGYGTIPFV